MDTTEKLYIVGIGASAGGLEATIQLVAHLEPEMPCTYVVLQHLSPTYRSMMVEILARETRLQVKEATHGEIPAQGVVHVVPPNHNAIMRDGQLHLIPATPEMVPKPSINQFFMSLAAEEGESAIGIVLSGTGSDGSAGLRAIQAAGGFTIAQKPETAKYDGMPRAAIESGVADHVMTADAMGPQLHTWLCREQEQGEETQLQLVQINQVLTRLHEKLQFDFSGYKQGTLTRRIRRRLVSTGSADMEAYLHWIDNNPQELDLLARDILISVTAFFRDREAFEVLRQAISEICQGKDAVNEIRVWVAGCASGEEAYSIAMLVANELGDQLLSHRVQIFATDIDEEALNVARRGVYPAASMSEVPQDWLRRYFHPVGNNFEASKLLRDMIVFARHNLVSDPPFLRLNLVSCRNVLIYFDVPLQAKVLPIFHFGLLRDGYLFLGRSESVAQAEHLFTAINRRERLFRKLGESTQPMANFAYAPRVSSNTGERRGLLLLQELVRHLGVTALLCNDRGMVEHTVGTVEQFMQFPVGSARLTLNDVVLPAFRGELMALIHRSSKHQQPQSGRRRRLSKSEWVRMTVLPLVESSGTFFLVLFQREVPSDKAEVPAEVSPLPTDKSQLEDELSTTREHLQSLIEEMATTNEEMQALNEEAQASNEELQATNEELEASNEELEAANEELQATNEELVSLNEELNVKTGELARLSDEYAQLYDSLEFSVLVFDRLLQVMRFNERARAQFGLRPSVLRQHVSHLQLPGALIDLEKMLGWVLAHQEREERTLMLDGRHYRLYVSPGGGKQGELNLLIVSLVDVHDILSAQEALAASQHRLSALMENTTVMFAMKDMLGNYQFVNKRFEQFFRLSASDCIGKNDFHLFEHDLASGLWRDVLEAIRSAQQVVGEYVVIHDGQSRILRTTHKVLQDHQQHPLAVILEAEDMTDRRLAEQQMRIAARVFDQAGEAIVVTDNQGNIQTVNSAFTRITGHRSVDMVGRPLGELLRDGPQDKHFEPAFWTNLRSQGFWQGEVLSRRKNGEAFPEWLTLNCVNDQQGNFEHYVVLFSDITNIKETQRRAEFLSTHDLLTGLPNRVLFQDRLRHAMSQVRRNKQRLALLFIDLDNFKGINDTLGHDVGDELLKMAADRLRQVVREMDTIARLGGDEFTAVLLDAEPEMVNRVASRIVEELSSSFTIGKQTLFVSASVGVAFYPGDANDSAALIKAADTAMYRAKEMGRARVEYFVPDLLVRLLKQSAVENALREGIRQRRMRLVYQPKFALTDGTQLLGAEALMRWQDPELGNVSPEEFIPVAENCGLVRDVLLVAIDCLIEDLQGWQAQGLSVPRIAFNMSPKNIREKQLVQNLIAKFQQHAIPGQQLQVEITEGALLENSLTVQKNLNLLAEYGLGVSIDDFGTGYSSLSYLKRLPLTELKLDKCFVDGLGSDANDEAIANAVLSIAHSLSLQVVAEGVETQEQLDWLRVQGCDVVQGYYLARPQEVADFTRMLVAQGHAIP